MNHITPLLSPIKATIEIPGSKSYTNRGLILGAMSEHSVVIKNLLRSDDTKAMIYCLQTLGVEIEERETEAIVHGSIKDIKNEYFDLNANLSGTTIRFLLALSCIVPGTKVIHGEEGLNKRPIKDLVGGLQMLGADITYLEKEGFPPLRVTSHKLMNHKTVLRGGVSSQYFSALLMIAPVIGEVTISVQGDQISKPYIDMTIDTMKQFGVHVTNNDYQEYYVPANQTYKAKEYLVEGDYSSAGYFAAIATLTKSTITLKNINPASKQADRKFFDILKLMGTEIIEGNQEVTVIGHGVRPLTVDMEDCPDQAQTLSVLAAFAKGITTITGIRSLRVKETERVKAVANELAKLGIKTASTEDTLTIHGGNPSSATIDTYGDHRMAMSFAVAGTKIDGIKINNPEVVSKTFPAFWKKLTELGWRIEESDEE